MNNKQFENIDQYIALFDGIVKERLLIVREAIAAVAPQATECIKYAMPTFVHLGNLVHFSACKAHLGIYPSPSGIFAFRSQLLPYKATKGAIHLPYNQPLHIELIQEIVKFRIKENEMKTAAKFTKKYNPDKR